MNKTELITYRGRPCLFLKVFQRQHNIRTTYFFLNSTSASSRNLSSFFGAFSGFFLPPSRPDISALLCPQKQRNVYHEMRKKSVSPVHFSRTGIHNISMCADNWGFNAAAIFGANIQIQADWREPTVVGTTRLGLLYTPDFIYLSYI